MGNTNVNKEIDQMMHSIFASKYGNEDDFAYRIGYFRKNPFRLRDTFCNFSTADLSHISFKNQILIRKIYDRVTDKYSIDYYDVICLGLVNISLKNQDYWSVVRLCEEIIEITKEEQLCSSMLKLRDTAERMGTTLTLNGYTKDALKYFTNPNDFEAFWIMCKKRCSNLGISLVSASSQCIQVKIEANGIFTGYGSLGEYSVGFSDGTILLNFAEIEEYANRKYKEMNHAEYPCVRFYENNGLLVFEASDFFYEDYFLRITCKEVKVSKDIQTPLFR